MATLSKIRSKVRKLTSSPSPAQLLDETIDEYINDFYLYDLPSHLQLLSLQKTYTFYTKPNVDRYSLPADPSTAPSSSRAYYIVKPPVYVAGYEAFFTQNNQEFSNMYPAVDQSVEISGENSIGPYDISIGKSPVFSNQVTVSAKNNIGEDLVAYDDGNGNFSGNVTAGSINYVTGEITGLVFTSVISSTEKIETQFSIYQPAKPTTVLFREHEFTIRPVPDKTYRVDINTEAYPTALLNDDDHPESDFIWQLLAAGASKKIAEDRDFVESAGNIASVYLEQLLLCQRRMITQMSSQRVQTIYAQSNEEPNFWRY